MVNVQGFQKYRAGKKGLSKQLYSQRFPLPLPPERAKYAFSDISHKAQQVPIRLGRQ